LGTCARKDELFKWENRESRKKGKFKGKKTVASGRDLTEGWQEDSIENIARLVGEVERFKRRKAIINVWV